MEQAASCLPATDTSPPIWLNSNSRQQLQEDIIPDHFALHLCGHLHEADYQESAAGGNEPQRIWQGRSLFGLKVYDLRDGSWRERSHGYTAGRINLNGTRGELILWPREARQQGGGGHEILCQITLLI